MKLKNETNVLTQLTVSAVFIALTVILCSFSVPVPGGHLYLCDVAICLAAFLLPPPLAMLVGGLGAFLGDLIFYPAPMFVSLATHGLQALVVSLFAHHVLKKLPKLADVLGVLIGIVILCVGYSLGRAYVYATPAVVLIKLPFEILQGVVGASVAILLYWTTPLKKVYNRMILG